MSDNTEQPENRENRNIPTVLIEPAKVASAPRSRDHVSTFSANPFSLSDEQAGAYLQHFLTVISAHRTAIIGFMALALAGTAAVTKLLEPLYEASAKVNIERRSHGGFIGQQASMPSPDFDMDQVMATQVEAIKSDPVLRPAAEHFHLLDREKQFKRLNASEASRLRQAPINLKRLLVQRIANTYLIRISYKDKDPKLAADVANMIAQSYGEHAFDSRGRSYVQLSGVVHRELANLQAKMVASGEALAKFQKQMNLVDPEQRINILSARLLQLNSDYTAAQSERLKKEAVLTQAKAGTLASAQFSAQTQELEHMVERLNDAKQRFAIVHSTFGENHYEYIKLKNEIGELESQVGELRRITVERAQADFNQALDREHMSQKLVTETKAEVDSLNDRAFQYEQLKSDSENYKKLYADLVRLTSEEDINRSFQDAVIQVQEYARPAAKNVSPNMLLNLALASILSALLGCGGALLHDTLDTKLRGPLRAAKLLNVDVVAALPRMRRSRNFLPGKKQPAGIVGRLAKTQRTRMLMQYQESIRGLRNTIRLTDGDTATRSLLLTSANPGEGKSTITANLAFSYALLGMKVLVIDADIRRPSLHGLFERELTPGLSEVLDGRDTWEKALVKVAREQLFLMPAGSMAEQTSDLFSLGIAQLLEKAYLEYDLVLLDGPPLLGVAESTQLASAVDAVLFVSKANSTSAQDVSSAYTALARARANVIGMVMNDVEGRVSIYDENRPLSKIA